LRILGIESSCDETAAAVVEDGTRVLSSVVASQLSTHGRYGGVVPELASREHLRAIVPVVREAMERSSSQWSDLAAVAATSGPGLVGSLLVGLTYAKALSFVRGLPLVAVNHVEGHIYAVVLEAAARGEPIPFPAIALVVSGGHTHLFEVDEKFHYRLLGKTRDDAAGEAFDKVAKLLGFGYPGGPVIDQLAPHGDPAAVRFTLAHMKGNPLDFSFSGLKTAAMQCIRKHPLDARLRADIAASFQAAVVEVLVAKCLRALDETGMDRLVVAGGVGANRALREALQRETAQAGAKVFFPPLRLCTDNGAMIAFAASLRFRDAPAGSAGFTVRPRWDLAAIAAP